MKKRTVALLCAAVMLLGVIFGGTMALLSHSSKEPLTNTFTAATINLELKETTGKDYIMAPGAVLDKDPTVTMDEDSASCYLFVKVEEKNNDVPEGMSRRPVDWEMADGWTSVYKSDGKDDKCTEGYYVYYRVYNKDEAVARDIPVLQDSQVTISDELTKTYMVSKAAKPELTFTAYAIQMPNLAYLNEDGSVKTPVTDEAGELLNSALTQL